MEAKLKANFIKMHSCFKHKFEKIEQLRKQIKVETCVSQH